MVAKKSSSKKKSVKKKAVQKVNTKSTGNVDKVLIQNFVSLQKVMVNLSLKFDELSTQISKLLSLFELSAKTLTTKDFNLTGREENKDLMKKIDDLLDQNKTIARGLALMYEGNIGVGRMPEHPPQNPPTIQGQPNQPKPIGRDGNYQKSISAKGE